MSPCHLGGIGVLVTRPAHQADTLCEMIEQVHGRPVRLATIAIDPSKSPDTAKAILAKPCDVMIFVSANAVDYAFPLLPDEIPADMAIGAVGQATAQRLADTGLDPTLVPGTRFDSEGLLALPELQRLQSKRVVIVRGQSGRPLLGDTLAERGAEVDYAEVYSRTIPQRDTRNLIKGWTRMVNIVTTTSNESLDNLFAMLGDDGSQRLQATPLIVVSERAAAHAKQRGCRHVHLAESALNAKLLEAICELAQDSAIKPSIW